MAKTETKTSKESFPLPSSSFEELSKIIQAYARRSDNVSLTDASRLSGVTETTISRNNGFLTATGLITGGNTKNITDLGKRLGQALEHDQADDIRSCLTEMVQSVSFLADILWPARMKKGNTEAELVAHILYAADVPKESKKSTGAHSIVHMFTSS